MSICPFPKGSRDHALEERAASIEASQVDRAHRMRQRATELRQEATRLNSEAAEYASGIRSATEDLPHPAEIEQMFAQATSQGYFPIPLQQIERRSADLPRLVRPLARSRSGQRVVFRVEGGGSRELITVSPSGGVSVTPGSTIHLNFGSEERALEFLQKREVGARIIAFEVDEQWIQSLRSAAVPEHGTGVIRGQQPRLVDVTYAHDQLEIPPTLIGEFQDFIVPGSGRVLQILGP